MSLVGLSTKRLVTCDPARATDADPLGVVEDAAVVWDGATIVWIGPASDAPRDARIEDLGARVVTPGLVDAHTHAAWVGSRHDEYVMRMAGADYRAIAKAGGGILASQRAIANASEAEIAAVLAARLRRMAKLGVTTCEVKSGYGLELALERKQLRAIAEAATNADLPHVVPTFLALHALPESARSDRAAYVDGVARTAVESVARDGLCRFVDAYIDENAFSVAEARPVFEAAKKAGVGVRAHVGQFADVGGAELAAELGALSVDHLEHVGTDGVEALARAGVAAVLLPTASFTLGQAPPPVSALRKAGVPFVVASDANPGTSPTESLPLAMAMAVRLYGLSPDEVLLGVTRLAAASLGLAGLGGPSDGERRGVLAPGARADLVAWNLPHEHALVQPWGTSMAERVHRDGVRIDGA